MAHSVKDDEGEEDGRRREDKKCFELNDSKHSSNLEVICLQFLREYNFDFLQSFINILSLLHFLIIY
jgi:hypothetical protein